MLEPDVIWLNRRLWTPAPHVLVDISAEMIVRRFDEHKYEGLPGDFPCITTEQIYAEAIIHTL